MQILGSKIVTLLALVAALIGIVTEPQFSGLLPADWSAWLASIGSILAAVSRALVDADGDGVPDVLQGRRGNVRIGALLVLLLVGACVTVAAARPMLHVDPPTVEYGCNQSPPNDRCIVVLRDSIGVGNMPVLRTDTVPVGVTRTVTINRTLTPGQRVVVLGSFEGLTVSGRKAAVATARAEGIYDPAPVQARPFIRIVVEG